MSFLLRRVCGLSSCHCYRHSEGNILHGDVQKQQTRKKPSAGDCRSSRPETLTLFKSFVFLFHELFLLFFSSSKNTETTSSANCKKKLFFRLLSFFLREHDEWKLLKTCPPTWGWRKVVVGGGTCVSPANQMKALSSTGAGTSKKSVGLSELSVLLVCYPSFPSFKLSTFQT